ncbi:hypothetical protein ElyMa_006704400 [Elysia marginata]|uniref:MATH domain-containing protein n=1 Tax=Elysia marginata TaxID=1093978 RepID=A0AAV4IQ59_9GAST|nr:hypothetical protein ElyMa_006704400 [Elysia marginata]
MDRPPSGIGPWPQDSTNPGPRHRRQRGQQPEMHHYGWQSPMECLQQLQVQLQELQFQQHLVQQQQLHLQQQQQQDMQQLIVQQYSHFLQQLRQQEQHLPRMLRGPLDFRFDRVVQVVKGEVSRVQAEMLPQIDQAAVAAVDRAVQRRVTPGLLALHTQAEQAEVLSTNIMSRLATLESKVDAIASALGCDHQRTPEQTPQHQQREDLWQSQGVADMPRSPPPVPEQPEHSQASAKTAKSDSVFSRLFSQRQQKHEEKKEEDGGNNEEAGHRSNVATIQTVANSTDGQKEENTEEYNAATGDVRSEESESDGEETVPKRLCDDTHSTETFEMDAIDQPVRSKLSSQLEANVSDEKISHQQKQQKDESLPRPGKNSLNKHRRREPHRSLVQQGLGISQSLVRVQPESRIDACKNSDNGVTKPEPKESAGKQDSRPSDLKSNSSSTPDSQGKQTKAGYRENVLEENEASEPPGTKSRLPVETVRGHRPGAPDISPIFSPKPGLYDIMSQGSVKDVSYSPQIIAEESEKSLAVKPTVYQKGCLNSQGRVGQTPVLSKMSQGLKSPQSRNKAKCKGPTLVKQTQRGENTDDAAATASESSSLVEDSREERNSSHVTNLQADATHAKSTPKDKPGHENEGRQENEDHNQGPVVPADEAPTITDSQSPTACVNPCTVPTCTALGNNRCRYSFDLHIDSFSKRVNKPGTEITSGICQMQTLYVQGSAWFLSKDYLQVWFTICRVERRSGRYLSEGDGGAPAPGEKLKFQRSTSHENGAKETASELTVSRAWVNAALIDPESKMGQLAIGQGSAVEWDHNLGPRLTYRLGILRYEDVKNSGFTKENDVIVVRFSVEMAGN